MPFDYKDQDRFFPRVAGDTIEFTITNIQKVDHSGDYGFKTKKDGNLGYYYRISTKEGISYNLNSFALYYKFAELNIQEGCRIKVGHPAKQTWTLDLIKREDY